MTPVLSHDDPLSLVEFPRYSWARAPSAYIALNSPSQDPQRCPMSQLHRLHEWCRPSRSYVYVPVGWSLFHASGEELVVVSPRVCSRPPVRAAGLWWGGMGRPRQKSTRNGPDLLLFGNATRESFPNLDQTVTKPISVSLDI
ncbi:hypothetical protein PBI_NILO_43 [Mycobacterium phage Nilo]|uniref:Uncharacterized protein n=1 Tax=Mycobacterium phage Nilo TaxID=2108129 RepID=A0A2P1JQP3_9CAUD|nr:hypothetical protein PBI_NILO_43 [Mycobacterium phage Nilo]